MTLEENLKQLIIDRYGTVLNFANDIGMSNSTLSTILTRGVKNANVTNIIRICKALDISVDELANGCIVPNNPKQSVTDLSYIISLATNNSLTLHGKRISDHNQQMLLRFLKYYSELIEDKE